MFSNENNDIAECINYNSTNFELLQREHSSAQEDGYTTIEILILIRCMYSH